MIQITKTTNKTITVIDNGTNGTGGASVTTNIILGIDCEINVYNQIMTGNVDLIDRYLIIKNKHNGKVVALINSTILDPTSVNYSTNMDTYAQSLRDSVLYT